MSMSNGHSRVCPTRTDGRPVLFTHKVSTAQCQDRQRGRYHKCFTCVNNNAWVPSGNERKRVATPERVVIAAEPAPAKAASSDAQLAAT